MQKPQTGDLYFHFKDADKLEQERKLYTIIGLARHSETEEVLVVYKAHYNMDYLDEVDADYMARPLEMFMDTVERDEYSGPRFILNK